MNTIKRNLKDLAYTVSRRSDFSKELSAKAASAVVSAISDIIKRGDTLSIHGLGTFVPRPTGQGRPLGGKRVVSVRFRPSRKVKEALRELYYPDELNTAKETF